MHGRIENGLRTLRRAAAPLLVFVLLYAPSVSHACSQCLATRTRANQLAFIWTTVFLSVAPLLVVGGIALWLRKKVREADAAASRVEVAASGELSGLPGAAPTR
jgi:hypothetical protein